MTQSNQFKFIFNLAHIKFLVPRETITNLTLGPFYIQIMLGYTFTLFSMSSKTYNSSR